MRPITYENILNHPEMLDEIEKVARRERVAAIRELVARFFKASVPNPALRSRLA